MTALLGCSGTPEVADAPPRTVLDDVAVEAPRHAETRTEVREVVARAPAPAATPAPAAGPRPATPATTDPADLGPPVSPRTLPGWRADAMVQSLPAIRMACSHARATLAAAAAAAARPVARTVANRAVPANANRATPVNAEPPPPPEEVPPSVAESLAPACAALGRLRNPNDAAVRAWVARYFVAEPQGEGIATGYYEPTLRVSTGREEGRTAAIMAQPPGPTPARAAIYAAVERGEPPAEVLAWADPVEAFFLEIQGSGRLLYPDGTMRRIGYAGQNGQPFVPIGRVLVANGTMRREEVSFQSLRAWMRGNPAGVRELLERNPSHVFFRWRDEIPLTEGPAGAMGIPLVPLRHVAVDRDYIPLGLPVWIATRHPLTGRPLERLMVAADTGGAIKGRARVDIFWGWEGNAEAAAGRTRDAVQVWVLRPRDPRVQIAEADLEPPEPPARRGRGRAAPAADAAETAAPATRAASSGRQVFAVSPGAPFTP